MTYFDSPKKAFATTTPKTFYFMSQNINVLAFKI